MILDPSHGESKRYNTRTRNRKRSYAPFQGQVYKTQENSQKTSTLETQDGQEILESFVNENVIWEQDYDKLMRLYEQLMIPYSSFEQMSSKIFGQLPQFSASELLLQSGQKLWKSSKNDVLLQNYCTTIETLADTKNKVTYLSSCAGQFLVIEKQDSPGDFSIIETDELAMTLLQKRKCFMYQLQQKFKKELTKNKLSDLSKQIIFLYHQYHKMKQEIVKNVGSQKQFYENAQTKPDLILKKTAKQLKEIKKKGKRK